MILLAWAVSENRRRFPLRVVAVGIAMQVGLALLLLKLALFRDVFIALNDLVAALLEATAAGTGFVFGYVGGGAAPFAPGGGGSSFVLAFQALPLVLVISALSALLYHWRVLPLVVQGFAWALRKTLGISGMAGVSTAANVFVGMAEAPRLVRPYMKTLGRGDLFVIMVAGMATIAGTVMVLYATFLKDVIPDPIGHLLTASILSAPAAVMIARLMVPDEDGAPKPDVAESDVAEPDIAEPDVETCGPRYASEERGTGLNAADLFRALPTRTLKGSGVLRLNARIDGIDFELRCVLRQSLEGRADQFHSRLRESDTLR